MPPSPDHSPRDHSLRDRATRDRATRARPSPAARAISLAACIGAGVVLAFYPDFAGRSMTAADRYVLPILAFGVAGGLVHALGYVPRNRYARAVAGPGVAWPVMAAALWALLTP